MRSLVKASLDGVDRVAQVVERLSSKREAVSSNPSTVKKTQTQNQKNTSHIGFEPTLITSF
jgi:hypothetical protein